MNAWRNYSDAQWLRLAEAVEARPTRAAPSPGRLAKLAFFAVLAPIVAAAAFLHHPSSDGSSSSAAVGEEEYEMSMRKMAAAAVASAIAYPAAADAGYARFSAASDTIRILGNTVFNQGDFTYEVRIRLVPGAAIGSVISEQRTGLEDKTLHLSGSSAFSASGCYDNPGTGNTAGILDGLVAGEWIHLAYIHQGSNLRLFINRSLVASRPAAGCYIDRSDSWMSIGMFRYGAPGTPTDPFPSFLGDLDWIRVSAGARYISNFTPPFECEVNSDAQTQLLLKFNEPAGTTTLVDQSPNEFVCQLGVPVAPGVVATSPTLGNTAGGFPDCQPPCPADVDASGTVNGVDLAVVLTNWGIPSPKYPGADVNDDGVVDGTDLATVLAGWGACP
jgi:hypothetical protein